MANGAPGFRTRSIAVLLPLLAVVATFASRGHAAEDPLFVSKRITPRGEYTAGIEGPAVDASGNLYVVNFRHKGHIGKVAPGASQSKFFTALKDGGVGNGIRFDRDGRMYIADFKTKNVWVVERGETTPNVYLHSDDFNQPNDLAIATDGTLYASDPLFSAHKGQVWRITRGADGKPKGEKMSSTRAFGVTNGIDLSPDGATLYVSESNRRPQVWAYRIDGTKLLDPRLIREFPDFEVDGLRTDVDGRIFLARPSASRIVIMAADGSPVREVITRGTEPNNLTFGGADGKTVFVTQKDGGFIEAFRTDRPGREH